MFNFKKSLKSKVLLTFIVLALSSENIWAQNPENKVVTNPENPVPTDTSSNPASSTPVAGPALPSETSVSDSSKKITVKTPETIVDTLLKNQKIFSIMYSDEEISDINRALDSYKNNEVYVGKNNDASKTVKKEEKIEDNAKSYIYLNSIIYFGENNWSVWINGKKISSTDNKKESELYIKSVSREEAVIVWTMSVSKWKILSGKKSEENAPINSNNQAEVTFNLKINQTYILGSGKIVEGRLQ